MSGDLAGEFLAAHGGGCGQKRQTKQTLDIALHMIGIAHLDTHHLITSTDAQHRCSIAMGTDDGLGTTIATQLVEIVECRLGSRQNDDIGLRDIIHIIGIEQMDARIALEGIEIGIVREVFQHDDSHIDLALLYPPPRCGYP